MFSISAASATYDSIATPAQNGGNTVTFHNLQWVNGGTDVTLTNVTLNIAGYVIITAGSVEIQYYTDTSDVVHTNFTFSSATAGFYVNSQQMVALSGNLAFTYDTTNGFQLNTSETSLTGFSFLGQSIGSSASGQVRPEGSTSTYTLGPITLGTPSVSLSNFSFSLSGALSVTITISDPLASLTTSGVTASLTNLSGSFVLGLTVNLSNPLSLPTNISASGFTLSVGTFSIQIGTSTSFLLTLSGSNVSIDPTAGPTQDLVDFAGSGTKPA